MNATATAQQKIEASANLANDPTGVLAFDKVDVNRDGLLDLKDAKLVDYYAGKKYTNLEHQLNAVQGLDGDSPQYTQSTTMKPISLVDVELNDSAQGGIDTFDFGVIRPRLGTPGHPELGGLLIDGDANFSGHVDFDDYVRIDIGFNSQNNEGFITTWSNGDFNSNGAINFDDYVMIDVAFNTQPGGPGGRPLMRTTPDVTGGEIIGYHVNLFGQPYIDAYNAALAAVPEPASVGAVVGTGLMLMLNRHRRRQRRDR
jgi:hypothetical protein